MRWIWSKTVYNGGTQSFQNQQIWQYLRISFADDGTEYRGCCLDLEQTDMHTHHALFTMTESYKVANACCWFIIYQQNWQGDTAAWESFTDAFNVELMSNWKGEQLFYANNRIERRAPIKIAARYAFNSNGLWFVPLALTPMLLKGTMQTATFYSV